jgi:hypothetical protein
MWHYSSKYLVEHLDTNPIYIYYYKNVRIVFHILER